MNTFLLLVALLIANVIIAAPFPDENVEGSLVNISRQLNRLELQLNQSIDRLLHRIDDNTHDIIHLIKHSASSEAHGDQPPPMRPVSALLIIDVQNDFISGSLALKNCPSKHNGEEVVPVINQLLDSIDFDVIVYSFDWHPQDHISFYDNLPLRAHLLTEDSIPLANLTVYSTATFNISGLAQMQQTMWPRHCVQKTVGAQMHPDLHLLEEQTDPNRTVIHIYKGTKPDIDSYSAFWDNMKLSETSLHQQLLAKNVTQVFVAGLATDWCVYSTAVHAIEHGYKTFIIEDASRGVDETAIQQRLKDFIEKNGHVIRSDQVKEQLK